MQNTSANKPSRINQAKTEANEKLTGLSSSGKIIVEFGYGKIAITEDKRSRVPARSNCSTIVAGRCAA
ncbi:MAG: hypothetical protein WC593_00525 [Methanoregula sp.]